MMKWNREDWQGRSKKQVESTNKLLALTFIVGTGIMLLGVIIQSIID